MRRIKWFLPADDRPFNPLGCSSSDSGASAAFGRRSEDRMLDRPTRSTDLIGVQPAVRALRGRPGVSIRCCAASWARPVGGRHLGSSTDD
jgi:hypothetical protein